MIVSSRGTAFGSRDQPALESAGFARRCRRLRVGAVAAVRSEKNEYLSVRKFVCKAQIPEGLRSGLPDCLC